jgi:ABC-type nitrate/sulfonate/bicarbonate transport system substrate-binding protein
MSKKRSSKPSRRQFLAGSGVALGALAATGLSSRPALSQPKPVKITLGYQTLWAAQGEIFETLRRTNILELNGVQAEFKTFTFGGPLAEAAVAGEIDNIVAADIPVLRGAARLPGTKILARTHDARWALVSQPDFTGGLGDLRGKKLSGAFATTTFPRSVEAIVAAGIKDPFRELTIINQDVAEQVNALQSKQVDIVSTWDPTLEKLVRSGYRLVHESARGDNPAWFALTGKWLAANGEDAAVRVLKAFVTAVWWTSNNIDTAHGWFSQTSRIDRELLIAATQQDRYLSAPVPDITTLDFQIAAAQSESSQRVINFLVERKLLQTPIEVSPFIDNSLVRRAEKEIAAGPRLALGDIKVVAG